MNFEGPQTFGLQQVPITFLPLVVCFFFFFLPLVRGFPSGLDGKESAHDAGYLGSIPGLGRYAGKGNGNLLQYSCLENPIDREA